MQARQSGLIFVICLSLCLTPDIAPAWDNTPAVAVYVTPYGLTWSGDEAETPESPLLAEIGAGSGGNTAWGRATPGNLKLTTAIVNGPDSDSRSHAVARFADHFHLSNPAMAQDASGLFYFRFVLSGTMRILASDWQSGAMVAVGANAWNQQHVGMLSFYRIGSTPTLYGLSGDGGSYPENNMFANPDGSMKVYAVVTTPVNGYYTVQVNVPVAFPLVNFPINRDPGLNDWLNLLQIELTVASFRNADCDFSSTFAMADQNPIVPDPDSTMMPACGWQFECASAEIALPVVTSVATSTGTGEAAIVPDRGIMNGLTALTLADFPAGLSDGNFEHGWFGLGLAGFNPGETVVLGFSLPGDMSTGTVWWYHDGSEWQSLPFYDDDGDNFLALSVTDNGPGDLDSADGAIELRGGITDAVPTPLLFQSFSASWRDGGCDLSWRAPMIDPARLTLTGALGNASWSVALAGDGNGQVTARDEAPALGSGGSVRYDLALDGLLVDSRTIELAVPRLTAALVDISPNPCNPQTAISFSVDRAGSLELSVFDLSGHRVATLARGHREPGTHTVYWQGENAQGHAVPSGTYVVRLESDQTRQSRKLSLVR
jgi:hypothetical protein